MGPTPLNAVDSMKKSDLVCRVRDRIDRRKQLIFMTTKGQALNEKRVPLAVELVQSATARLPTCEMAMVLDVLKTV